MKEMVIYKTINMLSLDVTLGAMILSWSIGQLIGVDMPWSVNACLGIAIWSIYTFDHLVDANSTGQHPATKRHAFHKKHFRLLSYVVAGAVLTGIGVATTLPIVTFYYGLGLTCIVSMYFTVILFYRRFYFKEGLVAFVYATGIFLGPLSLLDGDMSLFASALYLQLVIIAGINLLIFSFFEYDSDKKDGHPSLALRIGQPKTKEMVSWLCVLLLTVQLTTLVLLWPEANLIFYQLLFIIMGCVLVGIHTMEKLFRQGIVYRLLGDAVFFIPGIYLLF